MQRRRPNGRRALRVAITIFVAALTAAVDARAEYRVGWYAVNNGSLVATSGADWRLLAAIGQYEASGGHTGSGFQVRGGFLSRLTNDVLFADGFESGDASAWSGTTRIDDQRSEEGNEGDDPSRNEGDDPSQASYNGDNLQ